MNADHVTINVHLGSGDEGAERKQVLETIARGLGHTWGSGSSIGRWLVSVADEPGAYLHPGAIAQVIYHEVYGLDHKQFEAEKTAEIEDWLANGDIANVSMADLFSEWREHDAEDIAERMRDE